MNERMMNDYSSKLMSDITEYITSIETQLASLIEKNRILDEYRKEIEGKMSTFQDSIENVELENVALKAEIEKIRKETSSFSKVSHIISLENDNKKLKDDIVLLEARIQSILRKKEKTTQQDNTQESRVVGATTSDDNFIGLNTFNNSSEIVAPTTLQKSISTSEDNTIDNVNSIPKVVDDIVSDNTTDMFVSAFTSDDKSIGSDTCDIRSDIVTPTTMSIHRVIDDDITDETTYYEKTIKGVTYFIEEYNDIQHYIYEKNEDNTVGKRLGVIKIRDDGKKKIIWETDKD